MTLETFFNVITQLIYLLVAGNTALSWVRRRDQARLDIALVFVSLAITIIAQDAQRLIGVQLPLLSLVLIVALFAQPFLLLRVARYFRPVPTFVQRLAFFFLLLIYVVLAVAVLTADFLGRDILIVAFILAIGYFVLVESYATLLLVRGALTIPGVTGKRLRLASIGSGLLALIFLITLVVFALGRVVSLAPEVQPAVSVLTQIIATLSALSYYFGFAPPRWLRRAWQLGELHLFLRQTSGRVAKSQLETFEQLSEAATRTAGGAVTVIARWDTTDQHLKLELPGEPRLQTDNLEAGAGVISQAWSERQARAVPVPNDLGLELVDWTKQIDAQALLVVPILSPLRPWGLLIVALRYAPLFAQDDLDLLTLLAEQSAVALDYSALIAELRVSNQSLEWRVAERTAELSKVNRALRTISDCNQELVRAESELDLLKKICHIIVTTGGYQMAWVGYVKHDEARTVYPAERAGGDDEFFKNFDISWGEGERGRIPMGTAIRTGRPNVAHLAVDETYGPWREAALQRGYAACIALPLINEDQPFGGLGIFASDRTAFDADEVKLLVELANDLAFGIIALRTNAAHAKAEDALLKSEERFGKAFRASPAAMTITRLTDSVFIDVNESFLNLFGYRREEVVGHGSLELQMFRDPEDRAKAVQKLREQGYVRNYELVMQTKSGESRDVLFSTELLELDSITHALAILVDITDRKRAENLLRTRQEHAQSLLRLSRNLERAQTYTDILNAAREEVRTTLGLDALWIYIFSDDRKLATALIAGGEISDAVALPENATLSVPGDRMLEEIAEAKDIVVVEDARTDERTNKQIVARLGNRTIVNVPMFLLDKKLGALGTGTFNEAGVRFLTPLEHEFLWALASRVAASLDRVRALNERTQAEANLRTTLVKLERNNRELQDFAYVASHDLQEPLRKIRAFGDRLQARAGEGLDETSRDYLERMQVAAKRMQTLIEDLLTFSRVTTKAQPFTQADLGQVVQGVLTDLEIRIEQTGAQVEVGQLPRLDADPVQMRQVFQNLIGNALKFHKPETKPQVKVWGEANNGQCHLYVSDNGIGFEEKYLDRIFTPFQRLHGRGEYEGTGIGLAVVRKIVERHNGDVTATSQPGEGATFIVTLPVHQPKEP